MDTPFQLFFLEVMGVALNHDVLRRYHGQSEYEVYSAGYAE